MIVGLPKEIKNNEFRVGLTPGAVGAYVQAGNIVYVEKARASDPASRMRSTSRTVRRSWTLPKRCGILPR